MEETGLVSIGVIKGSYGLRGEVKVHPLTEYPERFNNIDTIMLVGLVCKKALRVEGFRSHKQSLLFKFAGINTRDAADSLRGHYLMVPEGEVYQLPEGSYYHFQLKGLRVYDEELGYLGILQDILETGANDVYAIKSERYGEVLIPAIHDVVLAVDIDKQEMQIRLLPGLLELNEKP